MTRSAPKDHLTVATVFTIPAAAKALEDSYAESEKLRGGTDQETIDALTAMPIEEVVRRLALLEYLAEGAGRFAVLYRSTLSARGYEHVEREEYPIQKDPST